MLDSHPVGLTAAKLMERLEEAYAGAPGEVTVEDCAIVVSVRHRHAGGDETNVISVSASGTWASLDGLLAAARTAMLIALLRQHD